MIRLFALILLLGLFYPCDIAAQQLRLTWIDNSGNEDGFTVERGDQVAGPFSVLTTLGINIQTYDDTTPPVGIQQCYRVAAFNSAGSSGYSNVACGTAMSPVPGSAIVLSCAYNPAPPQPSGLVAFYRFNESNGTAVVDDSSSGNNGTISGAVRTTQGRYGSALAFDGVNDWVTVSDAASLDLTNGMTLEAWVYPTVTPTNWRAIVNKEMSGGIVYFLHANSNTNQPATGILTGGIERQLQGGARLTANIWAHLAATYDGATQRLYVNGVQVASRAQSGAMAISTSALRIGGNSIWGEYFQGRIDNVKIYNRALSQSEIQADMNTQ